MFPAKFEYFAPGSLDEALSILERYGDEAKILAGGQSLIPLMKLRFAVPRALIDLNRIPGLDDLHEREGRLRIGPLVRHKTCERSDTLRRYGTLAAAAPQISDPIVRNLGTVAGSLAHADPQGDWGSALIATGAEVVARRPDGERTIPLAGFFEGPFTTALQPTELITEVSVPDPGPRSGGTYLKLERKIGDFATVGVAVQLALANGTVDRAGIGLTGVGPTGSSKARSPTTTRFARSPGSPPRRRSPAPTSAEPPTTSATSSASSPSAAFARLSQRPAARRKWTSSERRRASRNDDASNRRRAGDTHTGADGDGQR
jgi:aerobic carbon-monoxide dehydrogenase medium subunit